MTLKDAFKERVQQELVSAETRYYELDALYTSSLKLENALPQNYVAYLKRERDLAYMMFQLKTKNYKVLG